MDIVKQLGEALESQLVDELEGKKRSECGKSNEKRDVDNENQTL